MTRFRGKRTYDGEWVYGYYVRYGRKCYIYTGEVNEDDSPRFFEVSGDTVGEWTGFIDCKGNLVFDGDIFLTIDNHYSVATSCKLNKSMETEIVGNKWDNPELLNP